MAKSQDRVQIKVFVNSNEHRLLKLAAANQGLTGSDFVRKTALAAAVEEMRTFVPPTLEAPSAPRKKKT